MAMPTFLRACGADERIDLGAIGSIGRSGSRPVDDPFGQPPQRFVAEVTIVGVLAWVAGDEQHRWRCAPVIRSEPDPQSPVAEPDIDHAAVGSPSLPLGWMESAGLNQTNYLRREGDRERRQ